MSPSIRRARRFPWTLVAVLALGAALWAAPAAALQDPQVEAPARDQAQLEAWTREIAVDVARLRGLEWREPVRVAWADRDQFLDYMHERQERFSSARERRFEDEVSKLLGFVDAEVDSAALVEELLESQAAGFYDPTHKTFFVLDDLPEALVRMIAAHELVHALDDQHFDLDAGLAARRGNSDALWAYMAVVEGSATAVMNTWAVENLQRFSPEDLERMGQLGDAGLEAAPERFWKPLVGAYYRGASFLARTSSVLRGSMARPSPRDIDRAFQDPPASSEQVLHPDRYWNAERVDLPQRVHLVPRALPEGWSWLGDDTFGELVLAMAVGPPSEPLRGTGQILSARFTHPAAQGWGGDRHGMAERGPARVFFAELRMDDAAAATRLHEALTAKQEHFDRAAQGFARHLLDSVEDEAEGAERVLSAGHRFTLDESQARVHWLAFVNLAEGEAERVAAGIEVRVPKNTPQPASR